MLECSKHRPCATCRAHKARVLSAKETVRRENEAWEAGYNQGFEDAKKEILRLFDKHTEATTNE